MRTVRWAPAAQKDLRRAGVVVARRVVKAVARYAKTGAGDVRRLRGREGWRLRVGAWRVRFRLEYSPDTVIIERVLPRGGAYKP